MWPGVRSMRPAEEAVRMVPGALLTRPIDSPTPRPALGAVSLLGFAAALAVLLLVPPFLTSQVGWVRGFTGQEATDLLTPLVAMPLLALAVEWTGRPRTGVRIAFMVFAAAWVLGQGLHLAANGIGDAFAEGPARDAFYLTTAGELDRFLDEVLSHWVWHVAWLALLGVLLWTATTRSTTSLRDDGAVATRWAATRWVAAGTVGVSALAGILHGFTWFVVTDEGDTWPLAIPATVVLLALAWLVRDREPGRVVTTFLVVGSVVTLALYAIWIVIGGWPPVPICNKLDC